MPLTSKQQLALAPAVLKTHGWFQTVVRRMEFNGETGPVYQKAKAATEAVSALYGELMNAKVEMPPHGPAMVEGHSTNLGAGK